MVNKHFSKSKTKRKGRHNNEEIQSEELVCEKFQE